MPPKILLINGPNLNLLGTREPGVYGSNTLQSIEATCRAHATALNLELEVYQSNHEGALIDCIQASREGIAFVVINAGGLTHTSVALRDALVGVGVPFVEVHISNVYAREDFRHHSFLSEKAVGVVCGLGVVGYKAAIEVAAEHVRSN
ncbi:hypothetical protein MBLNU230_g2794t1 [Neophaeotheca triangularis]